MKLQPGLDRTRSRTFIYHPTDPEQDKQVYSEEAAKYYADGWLDSPAKRGQVEDVPSEEVKEVIPEVKDLDGTEEEPFEPPKKKAGRPARFKK